MVYLWIACGSALGGLARYLVSRGLLPWSTGFPLGTLLINVAGSFLIGYYGTLTLPGGRYAAGENARLFVMVGFCGGFTTFSSFSLQTLDLLRSGMWLRSAANVLLSVVLCLAAVALGSALAQRQTRGPVAVVRSRDEERSG